jgi:hypothetical protein
MWEMQILKEDGGAASCSESSESSVNNPLLYAENTSPVENLTPPEYTLVDPAFNRIQPATEASKWSFQCRGFRSNSLLLLLSSRFKT